MKLLLKRIMMIDPNHIKFIVLNETMNSEGNQSQIIEPN